MKKNQIILRGKPAYLKRMYAHLKKEHPSTKKRMTLNLKKKKK